MSVSGHTSTIHLLVQKGSVVNATDYHGSSPLHLACQRGHQQATVYVKQYIVYCYLSYSWSRQTEMKVDQS